MPLKRFLYSYMQYFCILALMSLVIVWTYDNKSYVVFIIPQDVLILNYLKSYPRRKLCGMCYDDDNISIYDRLKFNKPGGFIIGPTDFQ